MTAWQAFTKIYALNYRERNDENGEMKYKKIANKANKLVRKAKRQFESDNDCHSIFSAILLICMCVHLD